MPDQPLTLSVVVICYKQERYIADTLDSVLAQTALDRIAEIVVVDDHSPDGSFDVIRRYAEAHDKIVPVRRETNSGGCAAPRNSGIPHTTAPYVAFLDGDDLWVPEKVEEELKVLEARPDIGLLFSDFVVFDDETGAERPATTVRYTAGEPGQLEKFFVHGGPVIPSCAVVSRAAIDKVGAFDPDMRFNEDSEMWNRVASVAPVQSIPKPLFRKREWFGSLGSAKYGLENIACKHEITRRMLDRVPALAAVARKRDSGIELKTAVHHFSQGATAPARTHLRKALEFDPSNRKARLYLALSYLPGSPDAWLNRVRGLRHGVLRRA